MTQSVEKLQIIKNSTWTLRYNAEYKASAKWGRTLKLSTSWKWSSSSKFFFVTILICNQLCFDAEVLSILFNYNNYDVLYNCLCNLASSLIW